MGLFSKLIRFIQADRAVSPSERAEEPLDADRRERAAPSADVAPSPDPSELRDAIAALEGERYADALELASPYVAADAPPLKADANRLCALACSRLELWPQAFAYWLALFDLEPSAHNAQQLATTSVMCGELERGEAWLDKAEEVNRATRELSAVLLRTNFISALFAKGCFKAAIKHLEWLKRVYEHLSVTDGTFLQVRGVPFFSTFLENSYPILNRVMSTDEICVWYRSMQSQLDGEGRSAVEKWVERLV